MAPPKARRVPGEVHDVALKAAETDATKRALATFGRPFGLELYRNKAPVESGPTSPPQTFDGIASISSGRYTPIGAHALLRRGLNSLIQHLRQKTTGRKPSHSPVLPGARSDR
jgi:hypothetical protein